ncbi:uncharacterized protein PV06_11673 [Exophiala oligosperma]|uniref:peptidylprolyl isomerase n=1 Tax=Exophiala oligosperma TaxID=215243 RepID=A0A0D2CYB1_9EURO|nr:uncharacterized protein PV06_11673 [Exophiala oligosperma]KIW36018.1 hypothetical protein PV06_11673 [Exophiala oligosperma]
MAMHLQKQIVQKGLAQEHPEVGDEVIVEYTGWLYEDSKVDNQHRGTQFDSSVGRGDFKTVIGVGRVIPGMAICLSHVE